MQLVYKGKTKDVFQRPDNYFEFHFKDDATGYMTPEGPVFNAGYDDVVGQIAGKGVISCQFTKYFFKLFTAKGIPNDYVECHPHSNVMVVNPAKLLGAENAAKDFDGSAGIYNLEWVFRHEVFGSFWRRYPCMTPGNKMNLVEIYTKGKTDQLIVDDALPIMGIMNAEEVKTTKARTMEIGNIMYEEFAKRNLHLIDGKMEWGRSLDTGKIILIDDLSPDTFRVCKNYNLDKEGNCKANKGCIVTTFKDGKRTIEAKNVLNAYQEGLFKLAEAFELEI